MPDVTRILSAIELGDPDAARDLFAIVYNELRAIAASKVFHEKPGQTLQATALVHEAWMKLVIPGDQQRWSNRQHFFSAAAEAMRRILVDVARRKASLKHGGPWQRSELDERHLEVTAPSDEILAVHEALDRLREEDAAAAELVNLRYFAGFSIEDAAECLNISRATAYRLWTFARARLRSTLVADIAD
jgi:RNA polymerase sigma factor (TIGR02999 family)